MYIMTNDAIAMWESSTSSHRNFKDKKQRIVLRGSECHTDSTVASVTAQGADTYIEWLTPITQVSLLSLICIWKVIKCAADKMWRAVMNGNLKAYIQAQLIIEDYHHITFIRGLQEIKGVMKN